MGCFLIFIAFLLFLFFDVLYYLRIIYVIAYERLFQKRTKVTEPTVIYGFCFTQDLDIILKHMNNARFVRELDFARFHFFDQSGLYNEMVKNKTDALQAATSIRYRRVIPIFTFYRVVTQCVYWDEKNVYLEQKFITNDGFVRAIVLSKQTTIKPVVEEMMAALNAGPKPEPPKELELWIQSMEVSSSKLRGKQD